MTLLSRPDQIWVLKPTKEDLVAGANYAAITLPWTFNRMMLNTQSSGQQARALNIAKGIVGQEMLRRELTRLGKLVQVQRKSHRDDDLFDFRIKSNEKWMKLDLKTVNYFTDYPDVGREPLSRELIIRNSAYPGPDWRRFFPMLVPHTQIAQSKEAYVFAIASSIDFRRDVGTNRIGYALTAFPYGNVMPFLSAKKLCLAREASGKGFYIRCQWAPQWPADHPMHLTVIGEWDGKVCKFEVTLKRGQPVDIGPFSCVASFQVEKEDYDRWVGGHIRVSVSQNDYTDVVWNSLRKNLNVAPSEDLILMKGDFCNLLLPTDYTLYVIGWITKEDFLRACRKYTGWVWPLDRINKFENQPWSQITTSDAEAIERAGFADCIHRKPTQLRAGWMKTNGRGGGACCYVYPNIGANGGVKETNLYVLPQDLRPMEELGQ